MIDYPIINEFVKGDGLSCLIREIFTIADGNVDFTCGQVIEKIL